MARKKVRPPVFDRMMVKAKNEIGRWVFGELVPDDTGSYYMRWMIGKQPWRMARISPHTLCKATGCCDSDGMPIYENDYLQVVNPCGGTENKAFVWFDKGKLAYRIKMSVVTLDLYNVLHFVESAGWEIRVVGNRFDEEKDGSSKD